MHKWKLIVVFSIYILCLIVFLLVDILEDNYKSKSGYYIEQKTRTNYCSKVLVYTYLRTQSNIMWTEKEWIPKYRLKAGKQLEIFKVSNIMLDRIYQKIDK